jgi:hypothetical protein
VVGVKEEPDVGMSNNHYASMLLTPQYATDKVRKQANCAPNVYV